MSDQPKKVYKTFPPESVGDFLIVVEDHKYKEYDMEFVAYECTAQDVMENGIIVMPFAYEKEDSSGSFDWVGEYNEAQVFMSGHLKWDGCINFKFPGSEHVMLHCCGLSDTKKFSRLFEKLYKIAPECIKRYEPELGA